MANARIDTSLTKDTGIKGTSQSILSTVGPWPPLVVPGRILVALVAKLKLYWFWRGEGLFAELLRILEEMENGVAPVRHEVADGGNRVAVNQAKCGSQLLPN